MLDTTYTAARANLASLCDEAAKNREIVLIHRRNGEDVALISADELNSLLETVHLLRSPKNAERLLTALDSALKSEGETLSLDDLRRSAGLGE